MKKTFEDMVAAVRAFHEKHRFKGTANEDLRYRLALHVEELGELSAAVTKGLGREAIAEELADILILVLGDAVSAEIRLEPVFWRKMDRIMKRPRRKVGDSVRVTESKGPGPYAPPEVVALHKRLALEKKKTLEAFQANVRIFQCSEQIRAAYEGTVELAKVHRESELARTAVRLLTDPAGLDLRKADIHLHRGRRRVLAASSPSRKPWPGHKGGGRLVFPLKGEGRVLGRLEIRTWEKSAWLEGHLRTFASCLGLLLERLGHG